MSYISRDLNSDQIITIEELDGQRRVFGEASVPPTGTEEISVDFYERYSRAMEGLEQEGSIKISVSDYRVAG